MNNFWDPLCPRCGRSVCYTDFPGHVLGCGGRGVMVQRLGAGLVEPGRQKKRGTSVAARGRSGIPSLMDMDLGERGGARPRTANLRPAGMSPPAPEEDNLDFLREGHRAQEPVKREPRGVQGKGEAGKPAATRSPPCPPGVGRARDLQIMAARRPGRETVFGARDVRLKELGAKIESMRVTLGRSGTKDAPFAPPAPTEVPKPPAEAPGTPRANHAVRRTRPAGTAPGHYCLYCLGGPFGRRSKTTHIILHHPETLGHRVQSGKTPGEAGEDSGRGASTPVPAPSSTVVRVTIPDTAPTTSTATRSPDRKVVVYHQQEDQHPPGPAPEEE